MALATYSQVLATAQTDGPTLTAAAAATCLPAQARFTLPANFFTYVGQSLRIRASGRVSTVITTPGTMRFDVRFGSNVVADGQAVALDTAAAHTNVGWTLEFLLTCRAVGSSANLMQAGLLISEVVKGSATQPSGMLAAVLPWQTAPAVGANFDSTATQTVDLFFTQTVATGSLTLHQYVLEWIA